MELEDLDKIGNSFYALLVSDEDRFNHTVLETYLLNSDGFEEMVGNYRERTEVAEEEDSREDYSMIKCIMAKDFVLVMSLTNPEINIKPR